MQVGARSHIGLVRGSNQDSFIREVRDGNLKQPAILAVADGMGGHRAGEIASSMAIAAVKQALAAQIPPEDDEEAVRRFIVQTFQEANRRILLRSKQEASCRGMGTTLTMAIAYESTVYLGHVGDSRGYLFTPQGGRQITEDHSLVAELVRQGKLTEEEARVHPQKNVITRALGTDPEVQVDLVREEFPPHSSLLLCTDGLSNLVTMDEMADILLAETEADKAAQRMIDLANQRGGFDNATVVLLKRDGFHGGAEGGGTL